MKPLRTLLSPAMAVAVLLGASVAVAGGYTALSSSSDDREESVYEADSDEGAEMESDGEAGGYSADAPGQQFGHGDDWYGEGPRGLAVAEYAMHHGVPDGFAEHAGGSGEHGNASAEHRSADDDGTDPHDEDEDEDEDDDSGVDDVDSD